MDNDKYGAPLNFYFGPILWIAFGTALSNFSGIVSCKAYGTLPVPSTMWLTFLFSCWSQNHGRRLAVRSRPQGDALAFVVLHSDAGYAVTSVREDEMKRLESKRSMDLTIDVKEVLFWQDQFTRAGLSLLIHLHSQ
jgi:hypothetical protein